jgi:hypothetical protein
MKQERGLAAAVLVLVAVAFVAWFSRALGPLPAWLPLLGAIVLLVAAWRRAGRPVPRPSTETIACLAVALLYRLPALLDPWGWVNRDGAYGAFAGMRLRAGAHPAPVFTEGANYQGTLKGHLAALFSLLGIDDWSLLIVIASVVLSLASVAAGMALARRIAGRPAAVCAGLYLALPPRFLAVFSLNSVGQYVDVLALGGMALALLAPVGTGPGRAAAAGILLGAAFWQQPVALSFVAAGLAVAALRRGPAIAWLAAGIAVGALPVLLWNLQHDWASGDILGRGPDELRMQVEAFPRLLRRTLTISFPILAGIAPGHPWSETPVAMWIATAIIPLAAIAYVALEGRGILGSIRARAASPALLPALVLLAALVLWWATTSGKVYWRPRYLLPVVAATAVHLGVVLGRLWGRSRPAAGVVLAGLLVLNVAGLAFPPGDGSTPRLFAGREIAEPYARLVDSLERKGVRTGYSDFSLSAPVTMFTGERIILSSRLGPTPAYESEFHARAVAERGPDAYVLRADDDPKAFAAVLDALGVRYSVELEPFPVFYGLSRRVAVEEVAGFREGPAAPEEDAPEP